VLFAASVRWFFIVPVNVVAQFAQGVRAAAAEKNDSG
jgi:hypothetical protein